MAFIGKNPKFNSATYTPQAADPTTPSEGMVFYADGTSRAEGLWQYTNGAWQQIGAAGESGINYILNSNAEGGTTGWATYADAAGDEPVDGTGGTANITLNATTTASEVLRGTASFEIVKDAADRQGEGVSYDFTIDRQDRGKLLEVTFDFAASANFVAGDSSDIRVFVYDVTNGNLITPLNNKILTGAGTHYCSFNAASDSTSYRLIFHIATTNASAYDFFFDTVRVGPKVDVLGLVGTDWIPFTMNITGTTSDPTKGTVVRDNAYYRRVGDSIEVRYEFEQSAGGTAGSGTYLFSLPPNLAIDSSKVHIGTAGIESNVGQGTVSDQANGSGTTTHGLAVTPYDSNNVAIFHDQSSNFQPVSGSDFDLASQVVYTFYYRVPVVGWTAEVSLANSSVFKISNVLANGIRVTGAAPTRLGEWRSLRRNASARTYTDTSADPSIQPSSEDGIAIYRGNAFGTADDVNAPTRYQIYVGTNKYIKQEWYADAGRTGFINSDYAQNAGGSAEYGYVTNYDPTTGIFEINRPTLAGGTATSHFAGVNDVGDADTAANVYFDVVVSENAQAVGAERPRSEVWVSQGNGVGSDANNVVKRFTNIQNQQGSAITYTDSATAGASFTINEDGIYTMSLSIDADGAQTFGITLNQSDLTVGSESTPQDELLAADTTSVANALAAPSATKILRKGDVIRVIQNDNGGTRTDGARPDAFIITKISD